MSPTDAALDDLHDEQQRSAQMLARMIVALRQLGYAAPLYSERRDAYRRAYIDREYYEHLDWKALKKFNEERGR